MFHKRKCNRISAMALIETLLTVLVFVPATSALSIGPNNTAVLSGTVMTMTCKSSTEDKVIGWGVYTMSYRYVLLDNGCSAKDAAINDLITYENTEGNNVGTTNTLSTQAGLYECLAIETKGSKRRVLNGVRANLIVLENPIAKITKSEGDYSITLQCSVIYSGFWPPTVEWRLNGQTKESTQEQTINRVSATLKEWPTTDKPNYSGYSCVTYFDAGKRPDDYSANNVPSYAHTWTPYEPRNMKISPQKDTYGHSEELLCSADAQPEAKFSWRNLKTGNDITNSPKLFTPAENGNYTFQCKADNGVGHGVTVGISFTVEGSNSSQVFLIIVYVPVVLGFAILIPLIAVCIGKHRCARAAQNDQSSSLRAHVPTSARKGKKSAKPNARGAEPTYEYDDVMSPSSSTAQGYTTMVSRDNRPAQDYTEMQTIEYET